MYILNKSLWCEGVVHGEEAGLPGQPIHPANGNPPDGDRRLLWLQGARPPLPEPCGSPGEEPISQVSPSTTANHVRVFY